MSWQAVRAVKDLQTGSATKKLVLLVMADYAAEDGSSIYPSLGTVAERSELSRRSVITAVADLVSAGILIKERQANGGVQLYAIHPAIMSGNAAHLVVHTCEALSHPPVQEIHTPCETVSHPPVQEIHTPCETVSHPPVKDVHTPVKELHTPCEAASHKQLTNNELTNTLNNQLDGATPALVVVESPALLDVPQDPWYDPEAFPNEDVLASLIGMAIETVPKFAGSADRAGCRKIAAQLRDQFPLGADGEIDQDELITWLQEWTKFNLRSRRGGAKDGVASLRNWVQRLEAQHRNTKRARERDRGHTRGSSSNLLSGHELAALQFGGGAA
jgi:DNA-binding IscR family transcriptional regulator